MPEISVPCFLTLPVKNTHVIPVAPGLHLPSEAVVLSGVFKQMLNSVGVTGDGFGRTSGALVRQPGYLSLIRAMISLTVCCVHSMLSITSGFAPWFSFIQQIIMSAMFSWCRVASSGVTPSSSSCKCCIAIGVSYMTNIIIRLSHTTAQYKKGPGIPGPLPICIKNVPPCPDTAKV